MPTCRDSRGLEGTGRYVERDPRPTNELGRTLLTRTVQRDPGQWVPDLSDVYAGYVMDEDGVFRSKGEICTTPAAPDKALDTSPAGPTSLLTNAKTFEEGSIIVSNTLYLGTTPEASGDIELLQKLP